MRFRIRRLCAVLLVLQLVLLPLAAMAGQEDAEPALPAVGEDITEYCVFRLSTYVAHLKRLTDSDLDTVWTTARSGEQYLQFLKDVEGVATLSVHWAERPQKVTLEQRTKGVFYPIATYEGDEVPDTFLLNEPAVSYRLITQGEGLSVAEVRIYMGENQAFDFESMEKAPEEAPLRRPMQKGDSGSDVTRIQNRLKTLGYFNGKATGVFATMTVQAVEAFQEDYGLEPTGMADHFTRLAIYAVYLDRHNIPEPEPDETPEPEAPPRTASAFVEYIRSKIGMGYLYGAQGEISTSLFRRQKAEQYPQYEEAMMTIATKWDGMEVYDCNGLIKSFLTYSQGDVPLEWRTNVTGAMKRWIIQSGPIETMPKVPGVLLFQEREDGRGYMHIGVYTGEGISVHSRGHMYGVVEDTMPYLWTHWGIPSWLTLDLPEEDIEFPEYFLNVGDKAMADSGSGLNLQLFSAPSRESKYGLPVSIKNGTVLEIVGVPTDLEGHYWRQVTVEDKWGNEVTGYLYARDLTNLEDLPEHGDPTPEPTPAPTPKPVPELPEGVNPEGKI